VLAHSFTCLCCSLFHVLAHWLYGPGPF
jgi:hypothetical protein